MVYMRRQQARWLPDGPEIAMSGLLTALPICNFLHCKQGIKADFLLS